jgi:hypothetical protein
MTSGSGIFSFLGRIVRSLQEARLGVDSKKIFRSELLSLQLYLLQYGILPAEPEIPAVSSHYSLLHYLLSSTSS